MIILIHITLAVTSIILSAINFINPTSNKLISSYMLAIGTLASGVTLIVVNNASILRTCVTGLVFFAIVSTLNELARTRISSKA